jgi:hypothetical protein
LKDLMSMFQLNHGFTHSGSPATDESAACKRALRANCERRRGDLADRVVQQLFAAGLDIVIIRAQVNDPVLTQRFDGLADGIDATIKELRALSIQPFTAMLSGRSPVPGVGLLAPDAPEGTEARY